MYKEKMSGHTNLVPKMIRRDTKKWLKITIHQKTVTTLQTRTCPTKMHPETHPIRMHTEKTAPIKTNTAKTVPTRMYTTKM